MADKRETPKEQSDERLPLTAKNYKLLLIGFVIIVVGFILMSGGEAASPEGFNDNIFSWRRITLAPIVVVGGFVFEIYAIMKRF
ncbi:MAG: DUF3098 domain-containing protein [Rikenellaceae bacterium]